MLNINNLQVKINDQIILNNFNLQIKNGETHVIMGPNGVGKSTICRVILGDSVYHVEGQMTYHNHDLLTLSTTDRARLGIYLVNQNPVEIPGVTNAEMLRIALAEKSGERVNIFTFNQELEKICKELAIPKSFIHRNINEGMSGGERKKNEMLHLWMLKPQLIIFDELDSGLDVDSLQTVIKSIKEYERVYHPSILIITHGQRIIDDLKPDVVHVMSNNQIITSGDITLAHYINKNGFTKINETFNMSEIVNNE